MLKPYLLHTLFLDQTRALSCYMQITTMTATVQLQQNKTKRIYLTNSAAPVLGEFYAAATAGARL
jgi:ABC-type sugar transport system permease subunit